MSAQNDRFASVVA